ncbi:DnaJ sub C member 21, partial [Quaeritorhiza haematococci]
MPPQVQTCYYELLGVDRKATPDELKKAYRRKALELHPDKNRDRVDEATKLFAEIQQAYETLSDDQERAWYDSHREQILRGGSGSDEAPASAGTTTDHLMRFFSPSAYRGFGTDANSFYSVYQKLFQQLEEEEEEAIINDSEAILEANVGVPLRTDFGTRNTLYEEEKIIDGHSVALRDFYTKFLNFSTCKSFRWRDEHQLSRAPDRRIRRIMEKENKKLRDAARKEFNDTVRKLAEFLRKRDPRVIAFQEAAKKAQEAKKLENKARVARERRERLNKAGQYQEQDWAK